MRRYYPNNPEEESLGEDSTDLAEALYFLSCQKVGTEVTFRFRDSSAMRKFKRTLFDAYAAYGSAELVTGELKNPNMQRVINLGEPDYRTYRRGLSFTVYGGYVLMTVTVESNTVKYPLTHTIRTRKGLHHDIEEQFNARRRYGDPVHYQHQQRAAGLHNFTIQASRVPSTPRYPTLDG